VRITTLQATLLSPIHRISDVLTLARIKVTETDAIFAGVNPTFLGTQAALAAPRTSLFSLFGPAPRQALLIALRVVLFPSHKEVKSDHYQDDATKGTSYNKSIAILFAYLDGLFFAMREL
jgi:hypothetical protein